MSVCRLIYISVNKILQLLLLPINGNAGLLLLYIMLCLSRDVDDVC